VRCPRCGNENPGTNRFCGMCGATLLPASAPVVAQTQSFPIPTSQAPRPVPTPAVAAPATAASMATAPVSVPQNATAPRAAAPVREERPAISGPSFLGLNDPPPRQRGSLSITPDSLDPHPAPSSGNLDYLLEDEEPPKSGAWKFIVVVVVLALAAGVGYLGWKNHGFGWLTASSSKPTAATQPSDSGDSNSGEPPAPTSATPSTAPPASTTPAPDAAPAPSNTAANPVPDKTAPATTPTADSSSEHAADPVSRPPVVKRIPPADPNVAPPIAKSRPTAPAPVIKPARTADPVTEAQKYLYGKGVPQDCDRGLRLLKPAADHANPKAMIEMGALYSAGLCTPRDLPTAYRWFAMALHKDPDNQSVQTDLQKLWSEMTQPERQLAIKLSQ
jgi:hypothetical protein